MSSGDGKNGPVDIRGVEAPDSAKPPLRLEIRQLRQDPLQWNLYLLGLERLQQMPEEEPLSWFQIAGIHGHPYDTWPNQPWNVDKIKEAQQTGFCTHSSILFLPWHRPYLALFEYALHRHVTDIAEEFHKLEGRTDYIEAAKTFRIPYWDWAMKGQDITTLFPLDALQHAEAKVTRPGQSKTETLAHNPLGTYPFQKSPGLPPDVLKSYDTTFKKNKFNRTVRYPTSEDDTERDVMMAKALDEFYKHEATPENRVGKNLTERTGFILQSYNKFKPMSNNALPDQPEKYDNYGSLEDIHGAIHDVVGGPEFNEGHMSDISLSGFDPIFWLHHCNIDRLMAIWQVLHSSDKHADTYVTATKTRRGTFSTPRGSDETVDTALTPFTKNSDANAPVYWTSKEVKDTKTFGYAYPETQSWKYSNDEEYRRAVRKEINLLYKGVSAANIASASDERRRSDIAELRIHAKNQFLASEGAFGSNTLDQITTAVPAPEVVQSVQARIPQDRHPLDIVGDDGRYFEWLVNVQAEKHALNGHWSLHIFLGDPDDSNPYLYQLAPSYVGTVAAMGQDRSTGCAKCQKDQEEGLKITGQVPLTVALIERYLSGQLPSLGRADIIAYLKKNLHWRATAQSGVVRDRQEVTGLLVAVVTNGVKVPDNEFDLPIYDQHVEPVPEATSWPDNDGTGLQVMVS